MQTSRVNSSATVSSRTSTAWCSVPASPVRGSALSTSDSSSRSGPGLSSHRRDERHRNGETLQARRGRLPVSGRPGGGVARGGGGGRRRSLGACSGAGHPRGYRRRSGRRRRRWRPRPGGRRGRRCRSTGSTTPQGGRASARPPCPPRTRGPRATVRAGSPSRASAARRPARDRKSTRLNSSHVRISYAVFCLKKKKKKIFKIFFKKKKNQNKIKYKDDNNM